MERSPEEMELGRRIKRARDARGLTQMELAVQMGVTVGTISRWETGANPPDMKRLLQIAETLGESVDYFTARLDGTPAEGEGGVVDMLEEMRAELAWVRDTVTAERKAMEQMQEQLAELKRLLEVAQAAAAGAARSRPRTR